MKGDTDLRIQFALEFTHPLARLTSQTRKQTLSEGAKSVHRRNKLPPSHYSLQICKRFFSSCERRNGFPLSLLTPACRAFAQRSRSKLGQKEWNFAILEIHHYRIFLVGDFSRAVKGDTDFNAVCFGIHSWHRVRVRDWEVNSVRRNLAIRKINHHRVLLLFKSF